MKYSCGRKLPELASFPSVFSSCTDILQLFRTQLLQAGGLSLFFLASQLGAEEFFALMQAVHVISLIADPAVKVKTCSQRLMKSYVLDSQRCQLSNAHILHCTFQYLVLLSY